MNIFEHIATFASLHALALASAIEENEKVEASLHGAIDIACEALHRATREHHERIRAKLGDVRVALAAGATGSVGMAGVAAVEAALGKTSLPVEIEGLGKGLASGSADQDDSAQVRAAVRAEGVVPSTADGVAPAEAEATDGSGVLKDPVHEGPPGNGWSFARRSKGVGADKGGVHKVATGEGT